MSSVWTTTEKTLHINVLELEAIHRAMLHWSLVAEAYGSDSPGCVRQFHCSILHQQAGWNMVNTVVQGIRIPTTCSVTTGARENATGPVQTDTHCPTLAPGKLVSTTLRDVSRTSTPDTQHSSVTIPASRSDPSRSVQSPATRVESIWDALCNRGFLVDVASCVSRPQRESTLAIYESKWRNFTVWCNIQHINPLSASVSVVSDFLLHLHTEKYLAISTIAGYQMAIASTLPATSGAEVGRNPTLKSLLPNIEMEQGQHQRQFPEWNLALVLSALTKPPFEPLDQASDQLLTWKTVFLIALASSKRRGEIHSFEHA